MDAVVNIPVFAPAVMKAFTMVVPQLRDYPGENVQKHILKFGIWAKAETAFLTFMLTQLHSSGVVVDIGANTGWFSLVAASLGYSVTAVDANPIHIPYLRASIAHNGFENINIITSFVSDMSGETLFDGWSGYPGICDTSKTTAISNVSLKDLIGESHVACLKVDVEGAEPNVFKSGMIQIANNAVDSILFELTYIIDNNADPHQKELLITLFKYFDLYELHESTNDPLSSICLIRKIDDPSATYNRLINEYSTLHKKHDPSLSSAGLNICGINRNLSISLPSYFKVI